MKLPIRKKNRKEGFDYSSAGCYFITICTYHRIHYFGEIKNGEMQYTQAGKIAYDYRLQIPGIYGSGVENTEFVIMPNHMHGILFLHEDAPSISTIIKSYKQQCSKEIHKQDMGFAWQKSFHDHIIRNQESYDRIAYYIQENQENRTQDTFYS